MRLFSFLIACFLLSITFTSFAAGIEKEATDSVPRWQLTPHGSVLYNITYDTRLSQASREGEEYFFPLPPLINEKGVDENAQSLLEMKSIATRLGLSFTGPDVLRAKPSAALEMDFFSLATELAYMPRIRQAYLALDWRHVGITLLAGQYTTVSAVPGFGAKATYSGCGNAFSPNMRMPQIRFTYTMRDLFTISLAAGTHSYHTYLKPRRQLQLSKRPDIGMHMALFPSEHFSVALSGGVRWFRPRTVTLEGEEAKKMAFSFDTNLMMRFQGGWYSGVLGGMWGKNLAYGKMLGGYGYDPSSGTQGDFDYSGLYGVNGWTDHHFSLPHFMHLSLFVGYYHLLGSDRPYAALRGFDKSIDPTRADNMQYLLRVAPELSYSYRGLTIALSYQYHAAAWGEAWNEKHSQAQRLTTTENHRFLFALRYGFRHTFAW